MEMTIGFPRTLFYFLYYPFWYAFFTELGFKVVSSDPTNRSSLDLGMREAVNDACLPIKLYHGHVTELKDKVDILFMPRMVSIRKLDRETFCPKFLGLPDMVRNSISGLPRVIDQKVDLGRGVFPLWRLCQQVAGDLNCRGWPVWRAFQKARRMQKTFTDYLAAGIPAHQAIEAAITGRACQTPEYPPSDVRLAILGYPYLIYDSFVNVCLFEKLARMGIQTFTVEMVPSERLNGQGKNLPKNLFWNFSNRTVQAAYYYLEEEKTDGIIHMTAFGCGPDAMVDKLMELEAKKHGGVPFITLSLDEHTGEAGVMTRIEAFVDMLRLRRERHEDIISRQG